MTFRRAPGWCPSTVGSNLSLAIAKWSSETLKTPQSDWWEILCWAWSLRARENDPPSNSQPSQNWFSSKIRVPWLPSHTNRSWNCNSERYPWVSLGFLVDWKLRPRLCRPSLATKFHLRQVLSPCLQRVSSDRHDFRWKNRKRCLLQGKVTKLEVQQ